MLVADASKSAWVPRTSKTGGLPKIYFIKRKPEPPGKLYFASADFCFFFTLAYFFPI
jgi:hypothetical protein